MKLTVGKQYITFANDIIQVIEDCMSNTSEAQSKNYQTIILNGASIRIAKCKLIKRRRTQYEHSIMSNTMHNPTSWNGACEGDIMEYMADEGLYSGWDNRTCIMHIKKEYPHE